MTSVTACAPGSINIMGEHALIRGGPGIRLAVNKGVNVEVRRSKEANIKIQSRLGHFHGAYADLAEKPVFRYTAATLSEFSCQKNIHIRIDDDLPETVGLGSSAALVTALVKALAKLQKESLSSELLFQRALKIIRKAQNGIGSGIDIAGSVYGGMVALYPSENKVTSLPQPPAFSVLYSGEKTRTEEVVRFVESQDPSPDIFECMNEITKGAVSQAQTESWTAFGQSMNEFQNQMDVLKLNTPALKELLDTLNATKGVYGAKIAGAGLGDSVIAIGEKGHRKRLRSHPAFIDVGPSLKDYIRDRHYG